MRFALRKIRSGRGVTSARTAAAGAGTVAAESLSVAAQMALLCPSGIDVWMQRELAGSFGLDRRGTPQRRR